MRDINLKIFKTLTGTEKEKLMEKTLSDFFASIHIEVYNELSRYRSSIDDHSHSRSEIPTHTNVYMKIIKHIQFAFSEKYKFLALYQLVLLHNAIVDSWYLFIGYFYQDVDRVLRAKTERDLDGIMIGEILYNSIHVLKRLLTYVFLMDEILSFAPDSIKNIFYDMIEGYSGKHFAIKENINEKRYTLNFNKLIEKFIEYFKNDRHTFNTYSTVNIDKDIPDIFKKKSINNKEKMESTYQIILYINILKSRRMDSCIKILDDFYPINYNYSVSELSKYDEWNEYCGKNFDKYKVDGISVFMRDIEKTYGDLITIKVLTVNPKTERLFNTLKHNMHCSVGLMTMSQRAGLYHNIISIMCDFHDNETEQSNLKYIIKHFFDYYILKKFTAEDWVEQGLFLENACITPVILSTTYDKFQEYIFGKIKEDIIKNMSEELHIEERLTCFENISKEERKWK